MSGIKKLRILDGRTYVWIDGLIAKQMNYGNAMGKEGIRSKSDSL